MKRGAADLLNPHHAACPTHTNRPLLVRGLFDSATRHAGKERQEAREAEGS